MTKILAGHDAQSPIYMGGMGWRCQQSGCGHDATWKATTRAGKVYAACSAHKAAIRDQAVKTETSRKSGK